MLNWRLVLGAVAVSVITTACGDSDDSAVGKNGGTVEGPDGARVDVPAGAFAGNVPLRISKDASGAPQDLPQVAEAAGDVYAITPHGGDFDNTVTVSIPVSRLPDSGDQEVLLLTASPGDSTWAVMSDARLENGKMVVSVLHFSFFRPVLVVNNAVPKLSLSVEGRNNQGSGAGYIGPDAELASFPLGERDLHMSGGNFAEAKMQIAAVMTFAQPSRATRSVGGGTAPRPCGPVSYAHDVVQWRYFANGGAFEPLVDHRKRYLYDQPNQEEIYPAYPSEDFFNASYYFYANGASGYGAVHYYGSSAPAVRGAAQGPNGDRWALPPAGNIESDDVLTWTGTVAVAPSMNGRMRVEARVNTTCGLEILAPNLGFRINRDLGEPAPGDYWGVEVASYFGNALQRVTFANNTVRLFFSDERPNTTTRLTWEHSADGVNWQESAAVAAKVTSTDDAFGMRNYEVTLDNVQAADAGYYRAFSCGTGFQSGARCVASTPYQVLLHNVAPVILTHPQTNIADVGQTLTFTVGVNFGVPNALAATVASQSTIRWQSRRVEGFAFTAWQNEGVLGSQFTTPPLTAAMNATQLRAVVSNAASSAESEPAWLFVNSEPTPPQIVTHPATTSVTKGGTAVFSVHALGAGLQYQWRFKGEAIPGALENTFRAALADFDDAGTYDVIVRNSVGTVISEPATLTVLPNVDPTNPPFITTQPLPASAAIGATATFSVVATGSDVRYQWLRDYVVIPGATSATYVTSAITESDEGAVFAVIVHNATNADLSDGAALRISAPPGSWSPQTTISTHTGYGSAAAPSIAFGSAQAFSVWSQTASSDGMSVVRFSRDQSAKTWTAPADIHGTFRGGYSPAIAAAGDRAAVVFHYFETGYHIIATVYGSGGWTEPVRIDTSLNGNSLYPRIAIADNGRALASWVQHNGSRYVVNASYFDGTAWGAPQRVDNAPGDCESLHMDKNSANAVVISWRGGQRAESAIFTLGDGTLSPPLQASSRTVIQSRAVLDGNGTETMLWLQAKSDAPDLLEMWSARRTGATFEQPRLVHGPIEYANYDIAASTDNDGTVFAAWTGRMDVDQPIQVWSARFSSGSWQPAEPHSSDTREAGNVTLASASGGIHVMLWAESTQDSSYPVAATWDGAVWSAPHRIDSTAPASIEPLGVAIASNGTIVASWLRYITDFATVATAFLTP